MMAARGGAGIFWSTGRLLANLAAVEALVEKGIQATFLRYESIAEARMKKDAPWQDQTGAARNGLAAQSDKEGDDFVLTLYHQVPYGIYLETKNSGQYAIIWPTIQVIGPEMMASLERLMDRVG